MDKKPVPLPAPQTESEPRICQHDRVICTIGSQRFALDFYSTVTELNPAAAPVLPFASEKSKVPSNRGRKP
jgi:hypothetical protein